MASVYLYVIDSLRPDHVGSQGSQLSLTPNLDSLAADSVQFRQAVAQATWSKPSAAAMLTGIYPVALGMYPLAVGKDLKPKHVALPNNVDTLANLLGRQGFRTAAFTANPFVSARFGMNRGFDSIPDMYEVPAVKIRERLVLEMRKRYQRKRFGAIATGEDLHNAFLESRQTHKGDYFGLIWSMDTHPPLFDRNRIDELTAEDSQLINTVVSARNNIGPAKALYRLMVQYADEQVGRLTKFLKATGEYDESLIIVTSDHGEAFGENGMFGHAGFPYEIQIHVPLIIKFPKSRLAGKTCDELVGLIDLLPTIADWYGISVHQEVDGRSLVPIVRGEAPGHDYLVVHDQTSDRSWEYTGVRDSSMNYVSRSQLRVRARRSRSKRLRILLRRLISPDTVEEVFDLERDPQERKNVIHSERGRRFARAARDISNAYLEAVRERFQTRYSEMSLAEFDKTVERRLADLGYLD